jgi:hypothetical protein
VRARARSAYDDVTELSQLRAPILDEIEHFFEVYKTLEPGKNSSTRGYEGRDAARREIEISRDRARAREARSSVGRRRVSGAPRRRVRRVRPRWSPC